MFDCLIFLRLSDAIYRKGYETMLEFIHTIQDPWGMHMRPAGMLVKLAKNFKSEILMACRDKEANAKQLFDVMSLAARTGENLQVRVQGVDEEEAASQLKAFLESHC